MCCDKLLANYPPDERVYSSLADRCRQDDIAIKWIALLRAFTCIIVVMRHTSSWLLSTTINPLWLFLLYMVENVNVFFIISGGLLLPISDGGNRLFFKRRLIRLSGPFLIYTLGYFLIQYKFGISDIDRLFFEFKWFWIDTLVGEDWFIFVLTGIYLFMPFISPWLRTANKRQVEIFLLLWLAATCLPFINIKAGILNHNSSYELTFLGSFYNYIGYAVAGYYFVRWPVTQWRKCVKWMMLFGCSLLTLGTMLYFYCHFEFSESRWIPFQDLTLTVAVKTIIMFALFSLITSLPGWLSPIAACISKYSYSIYLCHPVYYKLVIPKLFPSVIDSPWMFPLVFGCTFLTVWIVSKTPRIGKYMR